MAKAKEIAARYKTMVIEEGLRSNPDEDVYKFYEAEVIERYKLRFKTPPNGKQTLVFHREMNLWLAILADEIGAKVDDDKTKLAFMDSIAGVIRETAKGAS